MSLFFCFWQFMWGTMSETLHVVSRNLGNKTIIHPSTGSGGSGSRISKVAQMSFSLANFSSSSWGLQGFLRPDVIWVWPKLSSQLNAVMCNPPSVFWFHAEVSSLLDMPEVQPKGCAGGIMIRYPNHLNCFQDEGAAVLLRALSGCLSSSPPDGAFKTKTQVRYCTKRGYYFQWRNRLRSLGPLCWFFARFQLNWSSVTLLRSYQTLS